MPRVLAKYWTIFAICLAERLTYRTDFFLGTLMRFLPIVTTIFLWGAVFAGSADSQIAGFTSREIVAYYLLVLVGRAFSSMPGLAAGIAKDVRDGNVKKYLIQPVDMVGFLLTMRLAHKLVYYAIATGPFVLVFILCREYFPGWPPPDVFVAFVLSLMLAFLIGFFFEMLIGLLAFWFLEISSFGFIIMTLNYVMSGHMFPLDLFPGPIATAIQWLPFPYMAYFPAKLFLSGASWSAATLWSSLAIQFLYAILLWALVRFVFRRGLLRYSAFGG